MAGERTSPPRQQRVVALQIKLPCATREELKREHGLELSQATFFVRTRSPKPVNTLVRFELKLEQGEPFLRGLGVVTKSQAEDDHGTPSGMLLQLRGLDASSHLFLHGIGLRIPIPTIRAGVSGDAESRRYLKEAPAGEVLEASPKPERTGRHFQSLAPGAVPPPRAVPPPDRPKAVAPPANLSKAPKSSATSEVPKGPRSSVTSGVTKVPKSSVTSGVTKSSVTRSGVTSAVTSGVTKSGVSKPRVTSPPRTGPVIGIDFGTTQTSAAWFSNEMAEMITSKEGDTKVQSLFGVDPKGFPLVAAEARKALLQAPQNAVREGRRFVGRASSSEAVQELQKTVPFTLVPGRNGQAAANLAGHPFLMEDVASRLISETVSWAESRVGRPVGRAVLTVPGAATISQRQAIRDAAEMSGLAVERLISEPAAAAISYAWSRPLDQKVLVFRLGGGTFDVAILEQKGKTGLELLAVAGDTLLGGVDFDRLLLDVLLKRFEEEQGATFSDNPIIVQRFLDASEIAKISLSTKEIYNVGIPFIAVTPAHSVDFDSTLTRTEFEQLASPLVDRAMQITTELLAAKKLKPADIGEYLLVGGQTRMPLIQARLKELFGREPARGVNPEEAAALGTSMFAHRLSTKTLDGLRLDVLPLSLGLGQEGGGFLKLFDRFSPLPQKKTHILTTDRNNQTYVDVCLFQGEARRALDNEFVGGVRISGLPAGAAGSVKLELLLELTADGVLNIGQLEGGQETPLQLSLAYSPEELVEALGDKGPAPKRSRGMWKAVRGLFRKKK